VLGSNLYWDTCYSDWSFSWVSSVSANKFRNSNFKWDRDCFHQNPFQFIIHQSPCHPIVYSLGIESVVKWQTHTHCLGSISTLKLFWFITNSSIILLVCDLKLPSWNLLNQFRFHYPWNDEVKSLENNRQAPDGSLVWVWYCLLRHNAKVPGSILFFLLTLFTSFNDTVALVLLLWKVWCWIYCFI
jgi:hypothetical protein